jgi:two-component system cell cycle response regulator
MGETAFKQITISERLPSPSGIALKLIQLAGDESTPMSVIIDCVQTDPALSAQILKMTNSSANGMTSKVGSVATAIRLLGLAKVKQAALSFSLTASFRAGQCKAFDYERFWSDSLARAVAARYLAQRFVAYSPDEAFTCGLLSQIGRLALACVFAKQYETLCTIEDDSELRSRERELFGMDHSDMNAQLAQSWGMPAEHVQGVRYQHAPDSAGSDLNPPAYALAGLLHVAGLTSSLLLSGRRDARAVDSLACHRPLLGQANQTVEAILISIETEWIESGEMFSIKTTPRVEALC